ncbi:MAG: beta-galactosidase [Promethearchaeota archaeon]
MSENLQVKNGIFHLNGKPYFIISADYPYYRDLITNWEDRLKKIKNAGVSVITFYIPWRYHFIKFRVDGSQYCDFKGKTNPNKNVKKFIKLIHKLEMYAVIKPGPFIHAETDYGGLPDFVNPDRNSNIKPWRNFLYLEGRDQESKNKWPFLVGDTLPSPLDPEFLRLTKEYYYLIGKEILADQVYPKGPIIAIQFLNEGLYSDGRIDLFYSGDYTQNTFKLFRKFLKNRYGSIVEYNKIHSTSYESYKNIYPIGAYEGKKAFNNKRQLLKVIDWYDFGTYYYATWVNELKESMKQGSKLGNLPPYYCNFPPPISFDHGLDIWAARINPEELKKLCGIEYGYTNWIGSVNYNKSSYLCYSFLCGRASGLNLEENWGFGKLYDFHYKYGFTPLYQTLLAIASRSTGFNIYTGVSTANWTDEIDTKSKKPYPSNSPITETGNLTNKYYILKGLVKYLEYYGTELLESRPITRITIGLYQPYIQMAAFTNYDVKFWKKLGFDFPPSFGMDIIGQFHASMRELKEVYEIKNLRFINRKELTHSRCILFGCSKFLDRDIQQKLVNYVINGGILVIFGELPTLDEKFFPCRILIDGLELNNLEFKKKKITIMRFRKGTVIVIKGNPFIQKRGFLYQVTNLIYNIIKRIELVFPKIGRFYGKALPKGEIIGRIGNKLRLDQINSIPTKEALTAVKKIQNSLECDAYCKEVDIIVSHPDTDVYVFSHPKKDVQHIFIFNMQKNKNIQTTIHYQLS